MDQGTKLPCRDEDIFNTFVCTPIKDKMNLSSNTNFPLLSTPQLRSQILRADRNNKTTTPRSVKRIFPGPAGLMCDTSTSDILSQSTATIFEEDPWKTITKDFKLNDTSNLLGHFNIAWIKKQATDNQFTIQKVPFLAAILLSLEVSEQGQGQKSVNITLKDPTGSIRGNILYSLYQQYAAHLKVGTLLVLMQAAVLSCTCDKCDNHHLTVTPKSLGRICDGDKQVVLMSVDPESVMTEYLAWKQAEKEKKVKPEVKPHTPMGGRSWTGSIKNKNRSVVSNRLCFTQPKVRKLMEVETNNCDSGTSVKSRKLFSFKQVSSKENIKLESDLKKVHSIETTNSNECVAIMDSQISVKTDSEEHAQIWKEVLNGVDLSSWFSEEF